MLRRAVACALFALVLFVPAASARDSKGKLEVVTTLFPTYDFARQVGGDKVDVTLLLPPGVEPHTFEPKPQDVVKINKADVFIYTGKYMEPWAESLIKGLSDKGPEIVDASSGIKLMDEEEEDHDGDHHGEEEEEHGHHHHGGKDPHIWLDLGNAQIMVETIARAFAGKDPANGAYYLKNAGEYNTKLADLDRRYKETLAKAKYKTIIYGGHFAFGYFARRYGLEHDSPYEGFSPNAEPSPKAIAELIKKLRESGVKYIYYEELL
ncbi:MAG: zinc ABC transporter substrate-binding protein, partial [Candidatus Omnitrophota bacterium]